MLTNQVQLEELEKKSESLKCTYTHLSRARTPVQRKCHRTITPDVLAKLQAQDHNRAGHRLPAYLHHCAHRRQDILQDPQETVILFHRTFDSESDSVISISHGGLVVQSSSSLSANSRCVISTFFSFFFFPRFPYGFDGPMLLLGLIWPSSGKSSACKGY